MKCFVSFVCFLSVFVFVNSAPLGGFSASTSLQLGGSSGQSSSGGGANGLTNILSNIDLPGLLRGVNSFVKLVGVICPPLSQVLDNVIQNVTSTAFRVFGSAILRSGGLGGGGGGRQSVSVVLPTFPPDDDDDDDDDDDSDSNNSPSDSSSSSTFDAELFSRSGGPNNSSSTEDSNIPEPLVLSAEVPSETESSDSNVETTTLNVETTTLNVQTTTLNVQSNDIKESNLNSATATTSSEIIQEAAKPTTLYTSPVNDASNLVVKRHVRVTREADDQDGAESAPQPAEDLANVDVDDQDRNKRYLPFGGSVEGQASGGGSGNFLFDIIRNTADRAARTVGTVYRMVAGTESLGWGLTATSESSHTVSATPGAAAAAPSAPAAPSAKLVAGSGATEESDEKANAPGGVAELDVQKSHEGYNGEGIPGPITRLFVIANRGIANLVQDLILRLASTSERLVNFKARLITSLI